MAISIEWATTKRIFVPKADMPIVQASPEIRELDVDAFRHALKDMEASVDGMPWPDTHEHKSETVLSGIVYARIVRILAPYTVEFEDGQYAVSTVGANHNIMDVKIANQVSLLVQNSAGLIVAGSGGTDWTATERNQIRGALGLAGVQAPPAGGGQLQLMGVDLVLLRKALTNRLEAAPGNPGTLILYDDDDVTPLKTWQTADETGAAVLPTPGSPARRTAAT
jgi:hypothetical protein